MGRKLSSKEYTDYNNRGQKDRSEGSSSREPSTLPSIVDRERWEEAWEAYEDGKSAQND